MSQRYNFIHNLINNPEVYKIIQFLMSGTSIEKKIIKKRISKKKNKSFRHWLWASQRFKLFAKM